MGGTSQMDEAAIRKALDLGMRLVDTAEMYGNEELVGRAIEGQGKLFLATKLSPHHFKYDDVIRSCKESLSRLGVKRVDLYQLHWPNKSVPIAQTLSAMEHLVDEGMARHIGVSNFSAQEMEEAMGAMKRHEIVSNQVEYSLLVRDIERDGTLDFCSKNKITVIAYSPVAQGTILSGKQPMLAKALSEIAKSHKKTPAQVALNWTIENDSVVAIPKSSDPSHVAENAGASGWKLTQKERKMLEDSAISKRSIASNVKPLMSKASFLAGLYQGASNLKNRHHKSSSTTKSSKK
jgi:diketogulonate reductase-like aldo/keto reductase